MNFINKVLAKLTNRALEQSKADLLELAGMSEMTLFKRLEDDIKPFTCPAGKLSSKFKLLGGANNHGFIEHKCDSGIGEWVTKISSEVLNNRETAFLKWHSSNVKNKPFAVKHITSGSLSNQADLSFVTTEKLETVKNPVEKAVLDLHQKMESGSAFFDSGISNNKALEGGSKIRDVLINLVINDDVEIAKSFLREFFGERQNAFAGIESKMSDCLGALLSACDQVYKTQNKQVLGFVHGDFKASNMLFDKSGELRLIDFQYCCIGFREWDLAFFLAKKKRSFDINTHEFAVQMKSDQAKQRIYFFYIVAKLIHVRPNKARQNYHLFIEPTIKYLK